MRINTITAVALAAALAAPARARADRRYYAYTYDATIAEPGGLDVELWSTLDQPARGAGPQAWSHYVELETGITDRWDVALYNVFQYVQGGVTRYQQVRVETRYQLAEPGTWPVDPVLYLELRKEVIGDQPWAAEAKLIVAKDVGRLNVSVNLSAEQELIPGGGTETEWAYYSAASYELHPAVRLGAEAFGFWTRAGGGPYVHSDYAGPALSFAFARSWLVVGPIWGLGGASDRFRLRAILAFQL